ncbi:MAG: Segregation and condensation protein [Pseudomonadota bacterium]|jgi:segregation and condensation protein B
MMESNNVSQMKVILEAALLTSPNPLSLDDMLRLFSERIERATLRMLLDELKQDWQSRNPNSMELVQVASGWRFQALPELAPYLSRLNPDRPQRYSRAAMETLAIIAYRQPVTRGDIEELRGVAVNPNTIRQLQERDWIDVVGQRDVPGRPSLYATTKTFLDDLNLKSLADLPAMETFIEQPFAEEQPIVETATAQVDFLDNGESPAN